MAGTRSRTSSTTWPTELGVGITVSPGYAYERAPDQEHFLNRARPSSCSATSSGAAAGRRLAFSQSALFLDFLAGNQSYHCTPWGNPTRNIFGWQRPCYLLGEGYAKTFHELMDDTDWDSLRHRQLREVRRLHGPLRLRGDGGHRRDRHPLKALGDRCGGVGTEGRWRPRSRSTASARRISCLDHVKQALPRARSAERSAQQPVAAE